jgi:trehalose 6-phosphate phosphatase
MTDASAHQRRAATDSDPARPLALARAALDAAPAGLLTDLDGTLAPIVRDPDSARPLPAAVEALHALQARLAVVAVITGRAGADARRMLGSDQLLVVANHGLEWLEPGAAATPAREDLAWAPEAVRAALGRVRLDDGSWIEDKTLSATLHFRNAADPEAVRQRLRRELGDLEPMGLVVRPGRMSLEIRPAAAGNKGTALEALVARHALRGVLVMGDDTTDLDMFRAATEARAAGRLRAAILAVAGAGEAPPAIAAAADAVLPNPAAATELLSALAAAG